MEKTKPQIELLAPAGNMESFRAAISNGADAVYMGTKNFNARKGALNFSEAEFKEALKMAHRLDKKVYGVLNTLVLDSEWPLVKEEVQRLADWGVDALIVQDLGLAVYIREQHPTLALHASTQMSIHNRAGILAMEKLGFERVVVAREMSLAQIKEAQKSATISLEVFAHGALCVCYSGQCLMSSMIGGRSGNRGACAQPCRKKYQIAGMDSSGPAYYLSPKDLMSVDFLDQMIEANIASLKIEGRMKRPEYVAKVVSLYRKAIDFLQGRHPDGDLQRDKEELMQIFNRGFTRGFLMQDFGRDYSDGTRADNRGLLLSEEVTQEQGRIHFTTNHLLSLGDGVTFMTAAGKQGQIVKKLYVKGQFKTWGQKGEKLSLPYRGPKVRAIYKSLDAPLLKKIKESYLTLPAIPIAMTLTVAPKQKLLLSITSGQYKKDYESDFVSETPLKAGTSAEKIKEQMMKTGDTPYRVSDFHLIQSEQVFVPIGALNGFRREALSDFDAYLSLPQVHKKTRPFLLDALAPREKVNRLPEKLIYMGKDSGPLPGFISAVRVYDIDYPKQMSPPFYLKTETISQNGAPGDLKRAIGHLSATPEGFILGHYGNIEEAEGTKIAGFGFHITNRQSAMALFRMGFAGGILSPELSLGQMAEISKDMPLQCYAYAYGHLTLMTMRHCPFSVQKSCRGEAHCETCSFSKPSVLKDERGASFVVERKHGLSFLYNNAPHFLLDKEDILKKHGIGLYMEIRFPHDTDEVVQFYERGQKPQAYTRGYFERRFLEGE